MHEHRPRRWRPRRVLLLGSVVVLLLSAGWVGYWLLTKIPVNETVNALGAVERCTSCHLAGARSTQRPHPTISGHPNLEQLGCTACHGGRPLEMTREAAHGPPLGGTDDPFLPLAQVQVACARCHVPGRLRGGERLARGQEQYLHGSCASCHQPGGHPQQRIGLDLRILPQRDVHFLRRHLIDPRGLNPQATMWSLRDATYRERFTDKQAHGQQNLDDLIVYALSLADRTQRDRWAPAWSLRQLRIDTPCTACHRGGVAKGSSHHCPELAPNSLLSCRRCHDADEQQSPTSDPPASDRMICPHIRAALFRCGTCHLRSNDGATQLLDQALTTRPSSR